MGISTNVIAPHTARRRALKVRRHMVAVRSVRDHGGILATVASTHNVTLTASSCPSPQSGLFASLVTMAAAATSSAGNAPGLPLTPSDPAWRQKWLQPILTSLVNAIRYGAGGIYSVCKGLELYSVNGLTLGVRPGYAFIDTAIEPTLLTVSVPDGHDGTAGDRVWIWLSQGGSISAVPNSIAPPGGNQVLLGSCTTSGGVITSTDYSGVCYPGNGDIIRLTADTTTPTDFPSALLRFTTRNPSTTQEWKWGGATHEVIPSAANPLPVAAGGSPASGSPGTATTTAGAATLNARKGIITSENLATAAGNYYTLTLTNSYIAPSSIITVSVDNGTNGTDALAIGRISPGSGSAVIRIQNNGLVSAWTGTILISFVVN